MTAIVGPDSAIVDDERHVATYPHFYWLGLALIALAWIGLGFLMPGSLKYAVWVIGILHFAFGFYVVSAEEIGGIYFLGIPTIEVSGFPVFILWGFCRLTTYTLQVFEVRVPTDPEKIYRSKETESFIPENLLQDGFKPPIRVPFAKKRKDGAAIDPEDPLERRSTNEVSFYARLQISKFFDFDIRIGSMEDAEQQVEGIGVNFVNSELAQMTVAEALANLEEKSKELETTLRKETKYWGVKVVNAKIRLIEFSRSFNSAIEAVPEAEAGRQATVLSAEGEKRKRTLEGEGTAAAERADLIMRGEGLKNMAESLGVPIETILAAETARNIAQGSNEKIIVPGFEGLAGIVGSIAKGFQKTKPEEGVT